MRFYEKPHYNYEYIDKVLLTGRCKDSRKMANKTDLWNKLHQYVIDYVKELYWGHITLFGDASCQTCLKVEEATDHPLEDLVGHFENRTFPSDLMRRALSWMPNPCATRRRASQAMNYLLKYNRPLLFPRTKKHHLERADRILRGVAIPNWKELCELREGFQEYLRSYLLEALLYD